jgi:hypothetical protein
MRESKKLIEFTLYKTHLNFDMIEKITHHLGGCSIDQPDANTFMPDVWEHLIRKYHLESVIDVGAGAGWCAKWFFDRGKHVIGIEGYKEALAKSRCPAKMIEHDYCTGPFVPDETFDLGWSAEFLEHVEERFIPNFMATFKACRYVCITHGEPGQPGYHHVNCQVSKYWINKMTGYEFVYDEEETEWLRSTDVAQAQWGRRTLTFFRNRRLIADRLASP